jgi:hypothetical protein
MDVSEDLKIARPLPTPVPLSQVFKNVPRLPKDFSGYFAVSHFQHSASFANSSLL